jgi:nicotinamidase-related amidase
LQKEPSYLGNSASFEKGESRTAGETAHERNGLPRCALLVLHVRDKLSSSAGWRSPPELAYDRLIETINGISLTAFRCGMTVIYAHHERSKSGETPSRGLIGKPEGEDAIGIRPAGRLKIVSGYSFARPAEDAFSNAELSDLIREKGIDHLFLAGLDGVTSINRTARSALERGYRVTFIRNGILTSSESKWERLLKSFESAAAFAITSEEFAEFAVAIQRASENRPNSCA